MEGERRDIYLERTPFQPASPPPKRDQRRRRGGRLTRSPLTEEQRTREREREAKKADKSWRRMTGNARQVGIYTVNILHQLWSLII